MSHNARTLAALPPAILLGVLLADYPFQPLTATVLTGIYCALLYWRPQLWLLLVPAALPWLDLSPWSGRFYIDELDLMLLATLTVGYWRLAAKPHDSRLPSAAATLLAMIAIFTSVAAWRGLQPLTAPDLNSYANYLSPYSSLRAAKGTLWALLLLPLLRRAGGTAGIAAKLVPGMLLGLLFTGMAVMTERALFPGMLNFSSDYRPTAPFASMHTGGAALDAYLAMSFPFVAWWLLRPARLWQTAAALVLLLIGLFTGFTLFSRDVWLAYGASAAVLAVLHAGPQLATGRLRASSVAALATVMALLCVLLTAAFTSGGYRALGTLLVVWAATLVLGGLRHQPISPRYAAGAAVLLSFTATAAFMLLRADGLSGWLKGPYFAFLLTAACCASALLLAAVGPLRWRMGAHAAALGAFAPLLGCAVLVAWHWGGASAAHSTVLAVLPAVALLCVRPMWRIDRATISLGCTAAAVLAVAIPILGSAYMEERMSTVKRDWEHRLRHWDEALHMMPDNWDSRLLGVGLARYPAIYYWHNRLGEQPGSYGYESEADGNRYLRLLPPQHPRGYADPLRHLQLVPLTPNTSYLLAFEARSAAKNTHLTVALCRRWLLYPQDCVTPATLSRLARNEWGHYQFMVNSGSLGSRTPALVQLELATYGPPAAIDVDNISLRGTDGVERVRNGGFTQGHDGWFFSSDRDHLPWHIKNLYVHTYFEQGWLGLAALALLLSYSGWRLAARAWAGKEGAAVYLAALCGALVVGMFDSLFDVPRLTLLFFLLLGAALLNDRTTV
ncbi:hypothetical protein GTP44_02850 [Duganella sp. FT50W]|uniref:Uncharacterized protein n=1 Tax=Duganella lactea TaxID=2692173 RepID=A0A6L8MFB9_9BURK|nr:hypothetical protein [Duganella lactea]MYM80901.1 hypothetical protein [Duganella lactea]